MNDAPSPFALVIGAKDPVPGTVKTRLGTTIGHDRAAALYGAFLADLAARFRAVPSFDLFWACAPTTEIFPALVGDAHGFFAQEGADWTTRQRHIFHWTAQRGYARTVLIASDSPQIPPETVAAAFSALATHAAVLVPTYDGGYSLIGQRRGVDILGETPMSTGTVCDDLRANAHSQGLNAATLPPTWDIDEEPDLAHLAQYLAERHDAPATAAAMVRLGLTAHHPALSTLASPLVATGGTE